MFVSKQVSLSSTATELTSGVTIDQPVTVVIQSQSGVAQIGASSGTCVWNVRAFDSGHTDVPGELQEIRIDIEPGDTVWGAAASSATVNVLFVGR